MPETLQGLRVLDLTMNLPGPYLTWLLACQGARVVKVENPKGGDYMRGMGGAGGLGARYFPAVNRNKLSLALDLKRHQGREAFLRLLETYDVLVEGFRPGTLDRLGLGYAALREVQPRLICVSISGYGQEGPLRLRAGHDLNYLALAGLLPLSGSPAGEPAWPGVQIADLAGGSLLALAGLLMAVIQREKTGQGQYVDAAMFDGVLSLATMVGAGVAAGLEPPTPGGMALNGRYPCYGLYATADGAWMSLGALEPKFWQNFCALVERPDLLPGQFGDATVKAQVAAIFLRRTRPEWVALLADADCCCEPVLDLGEALASPLVAARGLVEQGGPGDGLLACPLRLSHAPNQATRPAPRLGQHSAEVLAQAGFTPAEIAALTPEED
ncbi:MAG: CoA transferase [Deltaproteobacteria bacterium]|nr:CoA transferase [Deltaproteobacteria bacterium]